MATSSELRGLCLAPFFAESAFPDTGGCTYPPVQHSYPRMVLMFSVISGRFCMPLTGNYTCCLPCPTTDWTYRDGTFPIRRNSWTITEPDAGFESRTEIANWVNVAAFVLSIYLMLSFIVLPVKFTHRHYLSVCLALGVIFIEVCDIWS